MPRIVVKGKIVDFHPTKSETVKVTIETELDAETAKLLWLLGKGLDLSFSDNQTTLEEVESTRADMQADFSSSAREEEMDWNEEDAEFMEGTPGK